MLVPTPNTRARCTGDDTYLLLTYHRRRVVRKKFGSNKATWPGLARPPWRAIRGSRSRSSSRRGSRQTSPSTFTTSEGPLPHAARPRHGSRHAHHAWQMAARHDRLPLPAHVYNDEQDHRLVLSPHGPFSLCGNWQGRIPSRSQTKSTVQTADDSHTRSLHGARRGICLPRTLHWQPQPQPQTHRRQHYAHSICAEQPERVHA